MGLGYLRDGGTYTYQSDTLERDPESDYTLMMTTGASDFIDADKTVDSEYFDDMTVGEIVRKVAGKTGRSATADPSIANIKIPYRLRYNQSVLRFLKELVEEFGGTLKPARGWFRSATLVPPQADNSHSLPREPQLQHDQQSQGKYNDIDAAFFDPHPARTKDEDEYAEKLKGKNRPEVRL